MKMRKSEEKQKRLGWIRGLGNGLLAIVILCGLAMVVPGLFRIEMFNVVSGSMAPQIPVGSLIGVRYEAPETLQPGDVIAFLHRDSVVTHRVVANEKQNHELITKGDANAQEDMDPVAYTDLIGKVRFHVPVLGALFGWFSQMEGKIFLIALGTIGALLSMVPFGNNRN